MVFLHANRCNAALATLAMVGFSACASNRAPVVAKANPKHPVTPVTITQAYATLSAAAPVGTTQETAIAALETKGWECWGYAMPGSTIHDTRSGAVLKGSVLTCQVLRGNEMNPFARKYTALLLFDKDKLAGIEVAQRHNAF